MPEETEVRFEVALGQLEEIVAALERGEPDLAAALAKYETGVRLLTQLLRPARAGRAIRRALDRCRCPGQPGHRPVRCHRDHRDREGHPQRHRHKSRRPSSPRRAQNPPPSPPARDASSRRRIPNQSTGPVRSPVLIVPSSLEGDVTCLTETVMSP